MTESLCFEFRSARYQTPDQFRKDMGLPDLPSLFRAVFVYYGYYLRCAENPRQRMIITTDGVEGEHPLTDQQTPEHRTRGIITLKGDNLKMIQAMANTHKITDIREMMTKAFIFSEAFKGAIDKGWRPAVVDDGKKLITYLQMGHTPRAIKVDPSLSRRLH